MNPQKKKILLFSIIQILYGYVILPIVLSGIDLRTISTNVQYLSMLSLGISATSWVFAVIIAVFVYKDCKLNSGRKPLLNAILAVLLGFIWGIIYLIIAKDKLQQAQATQPPAAN